MKVANLILKSSVVLQFTITAGSLSTLGRTNTLRAFTAVLSVTVFKVLALITVGS